MSTTTTTRTVTLINGVPQNPRAVRDRIQARFGRVFDGIKVHDTPWHDGVVDLFRTYVAAWDAYSDDPDPEARAILLLDAARLDVMVDETAYR